MYKYTSLENIFVSLNVISNVNVNEKIFINTNNKIAAALDTKYNAFIRFISGDSRLKMLHYVNTIINESIDKVYQFNKSIDQLDLNYRSKILCNLKTSCNGLENLKKTYEDDSYVVSYLDSIITRINIHHELMTEQDDNKDEPTREIDIIKKPMDTSNNYPITVCYSV